MKQIFKKVKMSLLTLFTIHYSLFTFNSCIEPPLNLPGQELLIDLPIVLVDMDVVWNLDVDWQTQWHYGWDERDRELWGDIEYPKPTNYEVRRYYLGEEMGGPHTSIDAFTVYGTHFRRSYEFGYYDLLLWSNIDSEDGTQVVLINEENPDEVTATTTVSRGMTRVGASTTSTTGMTVLTGMEEATDVVTGLYNQPEIFYSAYPRDVYISRDEDGYDYYDEEEKCWVKQINCELDPLVYIYLVQIIIYNNDGRIKGSSGDCAISNFASGTSVNTGHTFDNPVLVYFGSRFKQELDIDGTTADVIGGKLTTYGLCDMDSYSATRSSNQYTGSRTDLRNILYVDLDFSTGATGTLQVDVTEQCQSQAHGGVITVEVNAYDIPVPEGPNGTGTSLFVPTVEDYEEVIYDIAM